ncbi:MAG TPA: zinc ABC transporter substrate-binding protein [Candidatus Limnocylindrales bacterium]|nr:zinc ABC transporter substrate-binding protein [Candidatus Limnocylindrales bacterium]
MTVQARVTAIVVSVAVTALAACQEAPPPSSAQKPLVVASFYPLYEFSRQVAGGRAKVVSLVPPGVEPHDWEPSPQDVAQVQKARLFVYNGGGFEQSADRILAQVQGKDTLVVNTTAAMDLLRVGPGAGPDPHVWLDPVLAQAQVEAIRAGLERADPTGKGDYDAQARRFAGELASLHDAFEAGLRDCARRSVVVSHAAFTYLTKRYRLKQISVMGVAPESEPSPADLAAVVRIAQREKARYVFFETLVSPRLAETLAREIGAKTLILNPIEGLTKEEAAAGKSYATLMRENLSSLRTGLDCR